MTIERPLIGQPWDDRGRLCSAHYLGPDLIVKVAGVELPNFYQTIEAARRAASRHIDLLIKEAAKP